MPLHEVVAPVEGIPGLWCAPATIDLAGAEIELVSLVARESRLAKALEAYAAWCSEQEATGLPRLDYVLIDCPPSLGLLTVNALVAAPEVLIPIQCEYYALEGVGQLLKNIEMIKAHLNPGLHVSTVLLTMYDARTRLAAQVAEEVRTHFATTVLRTTIPRSVRISEAPSYGQTVMTYDPGSTGALSYLEAAREMAVRGAEDRAATSEEGAVSEKKRGLGRGLGALIPTAPSKDDVASGALAGRRADSRPQRRGAGRGRSRRRWRRGHGAGPRARSGRRRALRRAAAVLDHSEPAPAPRGLRRGRDGRAGRTRCARSACCSRSSCDRPARIATS